MTIEEQAALMRLGLRYIRENRLEDNWVGKLPTTDDVDNWEAELRTTTQIVRRPAKLVVRRRTFA